MAVYAFADVRATITGPGGTVSMGAGNSVAEEGIEIEKEEKAGKVIGADGSTQFNIYADESGTITVRLQKTSPTNVLLQKLYDYQALSSAFAGQNVISIYNLVTGDQITAAPCAFRQFPRNAYGKEGPMLEWTFLAGRITTVFGANIPGAA